MPLHLIGPVRLLLGATTLDWATAVGALVGAVGTVAAVAVALYLSTWRDARTRPRLSLLMGDQSEIGGMAIMDYDEAVGGAVQPIFLQVRNRPGCRTAHDVEVLLTAKWRRKDAEHEPMHTQFDSRPLGWAFVNPEAGAAVTQVSIPAGVTRRVEVMRLAPPPWLWASIATDAERERGFAREQEQAANPADF